MNEVKLFRNEAFGEIRTVTINNEPYFVGKDVAEVLGYAKARNAIATHVEQDDALKWGVIDEKGRTQETILINESGLYSLILQSKLPKAKQFKRWVTSEVLPSIRKHGLYAKDELLDDPDIWITVLKELKKEREEKKRLQEQTSRQHKQIEEMKPKAIFADAVSASDNTILIGELAKILKANGYNTGQKRLFERLRQDGYLMKRGSDKNMPTQKAMELGLFKIKESAITHADGHVTISKTTKVTGKGQQHFINRYTN